MTAVRRRYQQHKPDATKRAAGYIRVSQVGGREGDSFLSPDVQRDKIEAWAGYRGYTIAGWYVDLDRPASKGAPPRPEFERMMAAARAGEVDAIAVYRLTRFARSLSQAAAAYDELERLGVALISVTEDIDTTTVAGNLMRNILFALAEFESQRLGEEMRNVHVIRRRRGIANVTRPILGYTIARGTIDQIDEEEAEAVRLVFELRHGHASWRQIADRLKKAGHRPKGGGQRFAHSTLRKIVENELYAGLVRSADGLVDGQHPAIVPRDLWEQTQALSRRSTSLGRYRKGLLSGLLVCGGCGSRLAVGNGARREGVYRCQAYALSTPCPRRSVISMQLADQTVETSFLRRFDPARMPNRGKANRTRRQETWRRKAIRLRTRAVELTRALDELADQRYVKGSLEHVEYERLFARFAGERADAEQEALELEQLAAASRPVDVDVLALWPDAPLEVKQRALRLQIAEILVKPPPAEASSHRPMTAERLDIRWLT